jgi:hypothetical protein
MQFLKLEKIGRKPYKTNEKQWIMMNSAHILKRQKPL